LVLTCVACEVAWLAAAADAALALAVAADWAAASLAALALAVAAD